MSVVLVVVGDCGCCLRLPWPPDGGAGLCASSVDRGLWVVVVACGGALLCVLLPVRSCGSWPRKNVCEMRCFVDIHSVSLLSGERLSA